MRGHAQPAARQQAGVCWLASWACCKHDSSCWRASLLTAARHMYAWYRIFWLQGAAEALDALALRLGSGHPSPEGGFFFGPQPSSLDAALYACLAFLRGAPVVHPRRAACCAGAASPGAPSMPCWQAWEHAVPVAPGMPGVLRASSVRAAGRTRGRSAALTAGAFGRPMLSSPGRTRPWRPTCRSALRTTSPLRCPLHCCAALPRSWRPTARWDCMWSG